MSIWPKSWASNFAEVPGGLVYDGLRFPTVEHAFQAAKTEAIAERRKIAEAPTPASAKRMGRKVTLREGWDQIREQVMLDLLRRKFALPEFRDRLLATDDEKLVEQTTWHDLYWGCCVCPRHTGQGRNRLGTLLMEVRDELRGRADACQPPSPPPCSSLHAQ